MEHLSFFLGPPLPWDTHPSHSKPLDGVPLHSCGLDVLPIRGQQHVSTCSVSLLAASPIGTPTIVVPVVEAQTSHSSSSTIFSQPKAGLASVSHWHTPRNLPCGWRNMRDVLDLLPGPSFEDTQQVAAEARPRSQGGPKVQSRT